MSVVIGIDVGLLKTGVAALEDGKVLKVFTISVEGDVRDTGPRYVKLRESLAFANVRILSYFSPPAVIAIEQPDDDEGLREGHDLMDVMKLYGAFAVTYAECARLWRQAHLVGVTPKQWKGAYPKELTARRLEVEYGQACANEHEWDALGIADWAVQVAKARQFNSQKNLTGDKTGKV
jgi:hypothetical protein